MSVSSLRTLFCIDSLGVGGKERQAVALAKGLTGIPGVTCRVVSFDDDEFYLPDLSGVDITLIPRQSRWDWTMFAKLHRVIGSYSPHVIQTNGLISSFYALPLAKLRRVPLINGSIRNAFTDRDLRWRLERWLLLLSDYRVANSVAGLRSRKFDQSDSRNRVIYNGFDPDRLRGLPAAECLRRDESTKVVGMVAEFNANKDFLTFIAAARIVHQRRPEVVFLLVGDGPTRRRCQDAAVGLDYVQFMGATKAVERVIATFDIGVLCSFVEGLSNSILEYMALGKPVVATDSGGTRELVTDRENGFLVGVSDPEAVAAAINHLLDWPELAAQMGANGRATLERDFSITRMVESTLALYADALTPKAADRNISQVA